MAGLKRLKTSLFRFYYRRVCKRKWLTVKVRQTEFLVRPDNYIDRRLWIEGGYEDAQIDHLKKLIKLHEIDMFLDIGANVGLYSCLLAQETSVPDLHAFECDPRNLAHLGAHLRMNSLLERVQVHSHAIGDTSGEISFQQAPESSTGRSRIGDAPAGFTTISVPVQRLDDIMQPSNRRIAIKLDVEGFEGAALRGMETLLGQNFCLLQIEILEDQTDVVSFLETLGYRKQGSIGADSYFLKA